MPKRASAPKPRAAYHHGDLRRALLLESVKIVEEKGADDFALREAARRVGVDHRAAYRHFRDRASVLSAIATDAYRALIEGVEAALHDESRDDALSR